MTERYAYTEEHLLFLRQSPLCVKPPGLPPAEEWMGPPPETFRNQPGKVNDTRKGGDSLLLNQENRRPTLDRNASRPSGFADDLILGPPRNAFASATAIRGARSGDADKGSKDLDRQDRNDRFNFRNRTNDADSAGDRFGRDNRDGRDGRNNGFRRRGDQDQDTEGWSTVKPRKSFGAEGAERFQGRMGGTGNDRFPARDDRRTRDRDDQDGGNRRTFRPRDQEDEDPETPRRNGLTRGKTDPWFSKDSATNNTNEAPTGQKHIERKSWRDRAPPEERPAERHNDRHDRNFERRWDRQQRVENDPEWMDEPAEEPSQGRTEDDFRKFMEAMKADKSGPKSDAKPTSIALDKPSTDSFFELEPKVVSAPAAENRPDKFFEAYGGPSLDVGTPAAENKDAARPKGAKPSRFLSFLTPQENGQPKAEPPTPGPVLPSGDGKSSSGDADKIAFAQLIQKLTRSGLGGSSSPTPSGPPPPGPPRDAPEGLYNFQPKSNVVSPEPFQQYGNDRRDDPRFRPPPQPSPYEMMTSRMGLPGPSHSPPVSRPEHALHELLSQRQNQSNPRGPQTPGVTNDNTEFLMHLMQGHRRAPEPLRPEQRQPDQHLPEQLLARMQQQQQPNKQIPPPGITDRDNLEYQRERSASQRQQQLRGQPGPQGFMDESQFHPGDVNARPPQQPTQILQRPMPPPGLDHQMHPFHMGGASGGAAPAPQMQPQRPMIPPPGLINTGPRNVNVGPMPGMQFPLSFPPPHGPPGPGNYPPGPPGPLPPHIGGPPPGPPDGLAGPPRQMQPPPGFFGGPPPPGFMGPPGMGFQVGPVVPGPDGLGPGPNGMGYGGLPSPFDRRGMMPPGGFRNGP
ncbi:hypothetical protein B0T21DRAFT_290436 [Apiosordaria backusii]|uniref:Uncharacterized protein n=1 Tax=Apiosordaria backusii TaxID=314023 RepID=A0AA40EFM2_9PEZI|nr:hypothetical protein B0T21DRAFT_290436 [Apiosordaria backusii]